VADLQRKLRSSWYGDCAGPRRIPPVRRRQALKWCLADKQLDEQPACFGEHKLERAAFAAGLVAGGSRLFERAMPFSNLP